MSETETESLLDLLRRLDACEGAREWASTQPDPRTAWAVCQRVDWMLWIAAALLPRQIVTLAACDCAETVVCLIESGGSQMAALLALHIAREWAEGREDLETVQAASYCAAYAADNAACSAAYATKAAAAVDAASYSASCPAAYAADNCKGYAIDAATYASDAASYAAAAANTPLASADSAAFYAAAAAANYYAAANYARWEALRDMADLVRARISADTICASVLP